MHEPASILPLCVRELGFSVRGKPLLQDLSFTLQARRRTLIMGPNGAGKSLTLRLCHGLLKPSRGRIDWQGPLASQARRRHAMVFQRPVLLRRSALGNIVHALALAGLPRGKRQETAEKALARFNLDYLAERPARVLSGGEQQRLALARAWATRPQVLFLDEPTSALDPAAAKAIEDAIQTIHAEGVKIVMTTHDLGQARRLGDEVLFLHHGRLLEQTPAETFFTEPRSEAARAFIKGELLW